MTHEHYWEATDIPGYCICSCGYSRHYKREDQTYCIHDSYYLFEEGEGNE